MRRLLLLIGALLLMPSSLLAMPQQVYDQAMQRAAAGHDGEAIAHLQGAIALLPAGDIWRQRMLLAVSLLDLRRQQGFELHASENASDHTTLAVAYLQQQARPEIESSWIPAVLATVAPGSGHLWLGRLRDAVVAALMVWPMLLLTLWAAYRRMGPVTLFFGVITAWLWSGTVFSAMSLAERGDVERYLIWWQGLWQASGLPGRPW